MMKYFFLFLLTLVCSSANAAEKISQQLPSDLMYQGKPIDSLCFFNLEKNIIQLNQCGIKKEKYIMTDQNKDLVKEGYIGFNWKDTSASYQSEGYSYYKTFPAANNQYWVYTINNGGGSGEFTAINLVKRKNADTLEINTLASGDRCNGGIQDVKEQGDQLIFSVNMTASDFLSVSNQNPHHLKSYDDLAACATCCAAKAFYEVDSNSKLKMTYIDMGTTKNPDEMSTQGKYQQCFNNLFASYVSAGKTKLNENQLNQFVKEFNDKCIKTTAS